MSRRDLLRCVTITGADDNVDPVDLVRLSAEFPFVEWGILFSPKRSGTPRYPSMEWERRTGSFWSRIRCAAHLCGEFTRRTVEGDPSVIETLPPWFRRVQLNGVDLKAPALGSVIAAHRNVDFILQARDRDELTAALAIDRPAISCAALYDPSGGKGLRQVSWPRTFARTAVGFAGGIGPDNVVGHLDALAEYGQRFWIDMESRVRTNDAFDLGLVREVLELVAEWLRGEASR